MNRKKVLLRIALFLLLLLGCNFIQLAPELTPTSLPPTITNTATNTPAPTNTPLPPTATPYPPTIMQKGAEMVLVPAGEFIMGSNEGDDDEKPEHTVYLDTFYVDKYEVTNALYKACVEVGACTPPKNSNSSTRSSYYSNPEYDNYPVIHVNWDMAKAYCKWRGAQLPTEAQWEKAARGTDGRTYPWGEEEIDNTYANYGGDTSPVGSYEKGKSVYDAYDMIGNGWEWVADWFSDTYYENSPSSNPLGPSSGILGVKRGGRTYTRNADIRGGFNPFTGFRCASSPDASTPKIQASVAPIIESVNLRSEISAGSLTVLQDITFRDPQGDAYKLHYEIVSATVVDLQVEDGMIDISAQQQKVGTTITGRWNCGGSTYDVTLQVTVFDRKGNESNAVNYTINCK